MSSISNLSFSLRSNLRLDKLFCVIVYLIFLLVKCLIKTRYYRIHFCKERVEFHIKRFGTKQLNYTNYNYIACIFYVVCILFACMWWRVFFCPHDTSIINTRWRINLLFLGFRDTRLCLCVLKLENKAYHFLFIQ